MMTYGDLTVAQRISYSEEWIGYEGYAGPTYTGEGPMTTCTPVHRRNGEADTWTTNSACTHRNGDNTWG